MGEIHAVTHHLDFRPCPTLSQLKFPLFYLLCTDINECVADPEIAASCDKPNTFCENTPGSWQCSCNDGFEGDPDVGGCCK